MSKEAKFIKEIEVTDPDSNATVHLALYKHENGGMFAMDSSFVDQVLEDDDYDPEFEMEYITGSKNRCIMLDPFSTIDEPEELLLIEE